MNYEQQLKMLLEGAAKKEKELTSTNTKASPSNKRIPLKQTKQQDTNETSKKVPAKKKEAAIKEVSDDLAQNVVKKRAQAAFNTKAVAKTPTLPDYAKKHAAQQADKAQQKYDRAFNTVNNRKKAEIETVESIQQLGELDLKPWKKKSAFSKSGYKEVAHRQQEKMKQADSKIDAHDEEGDNVGVKKAEQEWAKAKSVKQKAEKKAKLAKESTTSSESVLAESQDLTNMLRLAGLRPLNG